MDHRQEILNEIIRSLEGKTGLTQSSQILPFNLIQFFWLQGRSRPPTIVAQFSPRDPTDAQSLWLSFPALVTLLPADSACDAPLVWPAALSPHRRALWVAMLRERRPVSLIHFDRALPF